MSIIQTVRESETGVLNQETMIKAYKALEDNIDRNLPLFCVHNRYEWLSGLNSMETKFTEEEINEAEEDGFIKTFKGVDCYLARSITRASLTSRNNYDTENN